MHIKIRIKSIYLISFLFLITNVSFASNITLMGARTSQTGNNTRVVFEFNKAFQYSTFILTNPERLVVDLTHASLQTSLKDLSVNNTPIQGVREAAYSRSTLRIVFDLKTRVKISSFILKPENGYSYRLVLNLSRNTTAQAKPINHTMRVAKKSSVNTMTDSSFLNSNPVQAITTDKILRSNLGRNVVVVIDPGHGGKDPGATGPLGRHEKNVVLAISKCIANDINAIPGMTTKMTRYGDYFITLRDRLRITRQDHGDFFVAIHADAFVNRDATGASVFALSQRGATSEAARWLAEKENYSELGGVDLANKSRVLRSVLIDLSQTATITQSLNIGQSVATNLARITPMHSRHVEQARFVVLKSPDIPSLLVETGFITNPQEERMLTNPYFQRELASAITSGVEGYFRRFPPPNSLFALEKSAKPYIATRKDTLRSIALRYGVNSEILKKMNYLRTSYVHSGQRLMVPDLANEN